METLKLNSAIKFSKNVVDSVIKTCEVQSALEFSRTAIRSTLEVSTKLMHSVLDKGPYYDPLILNAYLKMKKGQAAHRY